MSVDLIEKMAPEYPQLSVEEYRDYHYDPQKGGWAGLHYLQEKGVTQTLSEGMPLYARYGLDYTAYPFPQAAEVITAIREAGGARCAGPSGQLFFRDGTSQFIHHF